MPTKRQCERALKVHEDSLAGLENVVGLGIVKLDDAGKGRDNNAIAVYVSEAPKKKKTSKKKSKATNKKDASNSIPKFLSIKGREKNSKIKVAVKVVVQGKVQKEQTTNSKPGLGKEPLGKEPLG